ncbi:MAG: hypothetical protein WBJ48_04410 [Bacteroidales bacterium]
MAIEIKEISGRKEIKKFVCFPFPLYKGNPFWVPPLIFDEVNALDPRKNPSFEFCEAKLWMAYKDGRAVGRIAGIINHRANQIWNERNARFGWLDFIDDFEVSSALFAQVENWAKSMGMKAVQGPLGFSDMDKEGMLIEGFEELGTIATYYNHPYYPIHTEKAGYQKDVDWLEYELNAEVTVPEKFIRVGQIAQERYKLSIVQFKKKKDLLKYAHQIFEVLNESFRPLYGFAPLTDAQIDYYIKMYFSFIVLDFISVVVDEHDNVAAFGITMPSLSKAVQKSGGKILPFGFIHILRAMKKNDTVDFYLTAVRPELQGKGVNALLFIDLIPKYRKFGIKKAESNVELENNQMVRRQWDMFPKRQHKRRRAYIKHI